MSFFKFNIKCLLLASDNTIMKWFMTSLNEWFCDFTWGTKTVEILMMWLVLWCDKYCDLFGHAYISTALQHFCSFVIQFTSIIKSQLLYVGFHTWPHCSFSHISIRCSTLSSKSAFCSLVVELRQHSNKRRGEPILIKNPKHPSVQCIGKRWSSWKIPGKLLNVINLCTIISFEWRLNCLNRILWFCIIL